MEFFGMESAGDIPTMNLPNYEIMTTNKQKEHYFKVTMAKFVSEYITGDDDMEGGGQETDQIKRYSRNILQYYFVLEDYIDAVKEGDGLAQVHNDFMLYFRTDSSYNAFAIEMLVNVAQNEILSEWEVYQCIWSLTVNWIVQ